MVEFLEVILSPHIVWGGILIFFAFRFKSAFSLLLGAITDRIKNVEGYKKTRDGHELVFGKPQASENDKVLPNSSDSPPKGLPTDINQGLWPEDNTQDPTTLRNLIKAERASRYLWEYSYLNYFLVWHTQLVFDWIGNCMTPPTYQLFENIWMASIPNQDERARVLDALKAHQLITISSEGIIEVTPKGNEYHQWRGPLPNTAKGR